MTNSPSYFIAWAVTHIINILVVCAILAYCIWRYRKQPSRFNLALLVEPGLQLIILLIKLGIFADPSTVTICGQAGVFTCYDAATQIEFIVQLGTLILNDET